MGGLKLAVFTNTYNLQQNDAMSCEFCIKLNLYGDNFISDYYIEGWWINYSWACYSSPSFERLPSYLTKCGLPKEVVFH